MNRKYILLAAAAMTMAACSNDETATTSNEPVEANISAGIDTRADGSKWTQDKIGVTVSNATNSDMATLYVNVPYSTTSTTTTADFTAVDTKIYFQDATETVTFSAYAPYNADGGTLTVNTEKQKDVDFIYASGATASRTSSKVSFSGDNAFKHKMAQLVITVKTSTDDGFKAADAKKITAATLSGLIHDGTFNTLTGETATTGTAVKEWAITDFNSSTADDTRTYSLIVFPQDLTGDNALTLSLTLFGQTYETAIAPNMQAGQSYSYTVTVKRTGLTISTCTVNDWTANDNQDVDALMPNQ